MGPLDVLLGEGALAAFEAAVDLSGTFPGLRATVLVWGNEDGSVGLEVRWTTAKGVLAGFWRLHYTQQVVWCSALAIEAGFRGKGALTQLCAKVPPWWTSVGLARHAFSTEAGSNAERMLRLAGFVELGPGEWGCALPAMRVAEAVSFAKGEAPAPAWRAQLPLPTEEAF